VALTISTYTEPVTFSVNEPVRSYEPDDYNSPGSFAKILAGLLHGNEPEIQVDNKQDSEIQPLEVNVENYAPQEIKTDEAVNSPVAVKELQNSKEELSEIDSGEEQINVLSSALQLQLLPDEPLAVQLENDSIQEFIDSELPALFAEVDSVYGISQSAEIDEFGEITSLVQALTDDSIQHEDRVSKNAQSQNFNAESGYNEFFFASANQEIASSIPLDKVTVNSGINEGLDKQDESRAKRKDKITFEVRDYRTAQQGERIRQVQTSAVMEKGPRSDAVREITLELRLPYQESRQDAFFEVKAGRAFEDLLSRELHQNLNGDIVRHASMALRDDGEGTIRIALKPDSLGNVKIRLEMAENKITGHIAVESNEALNAFRKEISSLEQAFRDAGFSGVELNLSLTQQGQNMDRRGQEAPSFAPRMAALRYDESFGLAGAPLTGVLSEHGTGSLNMFA
jgi:flagellar hook-length control protein FliK